MNTKWYGAFTVLLITAACEPSPAGPQQGPARWHGPSFSFQPGGGVADSTSCDLNIAYAINTAHFSGASHADFYTPGGSPRTQCGALVFNENPNAPGRVVMTEALSSDQSYGDDWQAWSRRLRDASSGDVAEQFDTARVLGGG